MKLTQENEKLKEELKAMTARLEAAERKRQELASRIPKQPQNNNTSPSSRS
jgi:seryl-tRNA synthetase